ncbi:hypothetical protein SAMN05880574_12628 [Chryseobacterium sp. RU37D]|uniref:hypothetical protein n=1 Tax=Chryseobacterium sp. RU37D TaxID=1907397 RepID=UPI0009572F4F|nr:hypothetical protein [Chryseobacterium sp. RU37D]SIQ80740.1 hypothetical protein SAMN05880574_12628 [Chryseobacterium sp. RU37D]
MNFYNNFDNCQEDVIDSLKVLLYQRHENIFDRIDFEDDRIYQEPLLYAYITQSDDFWLDSIIFGYEKNRNKKIEVFSNKKGIVYIPNIGYFHTDEKNQKLFLEVVNGTFLIKNQKDEKIVFHFESLLFLEEGIELVKTQHPLFEVLFRNNNDDIVEVEIDKVYDKHIEHFNTALKIIKENYSEYFNLLKKSIKKVLIYDGEPYSFAALQAHNMIFLNAHIGNDEVFFLDHILHEGAHVIFNTLTYNSKMNLFKVPFKTAMSEITNDKADHGELYGRFHGMFTQSNINPCMEICIDNNVFKGEQHHELLGRFSSNMKRFRAGIEKFNIPNLYNEEGELWYQFFTERYQNLYNRKKDLIDSFDVSNQPYVFSYNIFKESNK